MSVPTWILILLSLTEVLLLVLVASFFGRLKKSEALLSKLQDKQDELLTKLRFNAQLEQELVETFERRQHELGKLDTLLQARAAELTSLIKEAQELSRSPAFLREIILAGHRQGKPAQELARTSGLSVDEVELIIERSSQ